MWQFELHASCVHGVLLAFVYHLQKLLRDNEMIILDALGYALHTFGCFEKFFANIRHFAVVSFHQVGTFVLHQDIYQQHLGSQEFFSPFDGECYGILKSLFCILVFLHHIFFVDYHRSGSQVTKNGNPSLRAIVIALWHLLTAMSSV